MKNLIYTSAVLFMFASCKKDDPQANAEQYCECMKKAAADHSYLPDCEVMGNDLLKKYPEGSEGRSTVESVMLYCGK
ncbi:MAG: hypothetical protein ACK40M_01980 [Flavobacteriales bacterium]